MSTFTCRTCESNEPLFIQVIKDILLNAEGLEGSNCIIYEGISEIPCHVDISTPKCGRGEDDVSSFTFTIDSSESNALETTIQENLDTHGGLNREHLDDPSEFSRTLSEVFSPIGGNEILGNSIPIFDLTPVILNDVTTPDISESSTSSEELTGETCKPKSTEKALLGAGHTTLKVKDTVTSTEEHEGVSKHKFYDRNRPKTQVFSQGKVYTYDKLEIKTNTREPKGKSRQSVNSLKKEGNSSSLQGTSCESNLNPNATSFTPKVDHDAFTHLKNIRINNMKNVIIGQLNINSIRNKFESLAELMRGNLDILVITETKLDHTFPDKQFLIPGYRKPFRRDRNRFGGGVMIYVREDIPCDILIKHKTPSNIEAIFVEINLRKNKLLLVGTYHSTNREHGEKDGEYFKQIGFALDVYSRYDKFLLAGDFNVTNDDINLKEFMDDFHAKNLVKEPTCFKSIDNPSCIDLFITNSYLSFQNTTTVATGLSDFHKMTVTVLKTTFPKAKPRVITYRTPYNPIDLENELKRNLEDMFDKTYENFENKVTITYNSVSAEKRRTIRANDKPWVTKEMRKEIMYRSQLENKKFKFGREEDFIAFKRQQNYCNRLYQGLF